MERLARSVLLLVRRWGGSVPAILLTGVLVIGGGLVTPNRSVAQASQNETYAVALRDVPLQTALQRLVARTGIDLAYSTSLVEGRRVYCRRRQAPAEALLQCILRGTGVDYLRTASGSYLLVESVETAAPTGRLAGTVVDAATGEPLPNANVLLADAGTGTATNEAGQFTVAPVLAGRHRLVVTYVGYATAIDSVRVPPNGRDTIRVTLHRTVLDTAPIVVDGLQQRLPSGQLGRATINPSELTELSGRGTPDVLRSAGRRIGVSLNRPLAEVNVQGGDSGEHVMLLDGAPVREPVSVGRLLGAFSPQALERLTVHKAGFGAAQGSYTAGVLEATHDLAREESPHAAASVDLLGANGRADVEWGRPNRNRGRALVAGRTSTWDLYRAPSLHALLDARTALDRPLTPAWTDQPVNGDGPLRQHTAPRVQFSDLHGALRQSLSPFQQVYVSGYYGHTRLETDVATAVPSADASDRLLLSRDRYDWTNTVVQGRYEWMLSSRVTGTAQAWGSWHDAHTFYGFRDSTLQNSSGGSTPQFPARPGPHGGEGNEIGEWGARLAADVSVSPNTRLRAAVTPQRLRGQFRVRNRYLGVLSHETSAWQVGSYLEAETSPGLNLTATAGTRLTYVPARQTVYAEPRLALRYDRSSTSIGGLAVRLAGGLYRQYVMQSELSGTGPTSVVPSVQFWLPIDETTAPPRAVHAAGTLLLTPADPWTARLETYYKWQPRTLHVDYAGLVHSPTGDEPLPRQQFDDQSAFMAAGRGRAYGAALHLQRDGDRVSAGVSGEWSRTERRYPGRFDGRYVPAPWAQPLRLTTDLDVALTDGLRARAQWQGIWNQPWALRRAYYDYIALADGPDALPPFDLSRPGDQTLDPFSRLDLGLKGETKILGMTLEGQVSLINVLDRHNPFDWSLDPTGSQPTPVRRTLPGRRLFVLLGLRY